MIFMQFKPDSTLVSYFYSCPTRNILYKHLSELKKCVPFNRRRITSCMHACQYETCLSVCICGGTHSTERRREGLLLKTLLGQCCPSGLSLTLILCSDSHSRCSFTQNWSSHTHTHTQRTACQIWSCCLNGKVQEVHKDVCTMLFCHLIFNLFVFKI